MRVVLWVASVLLAIAFLGAGAMKAFTNYDQLSAKKEWAKRFPPAAVKAIGGLEILGALGLILPAVTGIAVVLVPVAALGLAAMMVGAVIVHVIGKDPIAAIAPAIVLGLLAILVAWGRLGAYPL